MSLLPRVLTAPIKTASTRWFAKRAPKNDSATLNLRNVYIFFNREGMLFAVLLLITFIAGINYGNNLVLGLCFYLISVWLISFHVTFAHISGLQIRLLEVTTSEVGEPIWATLQLHSESRQPRRQLAFGFEQVSSAANAPQPTEPLLIARVDGEQTIRLPIYTHARGQLELPRLIIKTTYPLGIMRAWSYVYFARSAWVYPKPQAFDWQAQYLSVTQDDLQAGGQYVQGQDDFDRLDTYIAGESLARVSWGHVARGQGMFTKHFADPVGAEQTLNYIDMPAANHEQKLAQLAYGALTLGQLGVPFGMQLPNEMSIDPNQQTGTGAGDAFAQACLLRLAKVP